MKNLRAFYKDFQNYILAAAKCQIHGNPVPGLRNLRSISDISALGQQRVQFRRPGTILIPYSQIAKNIDDQELVLGVLNVQSTLSDLA